MIANADTFTGIAVSNPNATSAVITFTALKSDGSALNGAGIKNPVELTIPAGGQIAKQFTEIFSGFPDFDGWVQATSPASNLTGFFMNGNPTETDMDGATTMAAASSFALPFAYQHGAGTTEITLVNVSAEAATASLTLYDANGTAVAKRSVKLPAHGLAREAIAALFGDEDYTNASHILVQADQPLIGHEVVDNYVAPEGNLRHESLALAGQPISSATSYVLPEFATGDGWLSIIGLANLGPAQKVKLTAYGDDGALASAANNPQEITLKENGGLRDTLKDLFGFVDDKVSTGWMEVTASDGHLALYVAYGNSETPAFAAAPGIDLKSASKTEAFSQVAQGPGLFTGLALVNPGRAAANVDFYTMRPDGSTVGKSTFTLGPKQRNGKLFTELLPESRDQVGGWALVRSDQPLIGDVLFGETNGAALANIPPQPLAADYVPPEPSKIPTAEAAAALERNAEETLVGTRWAGTITWKEKSLNYSVGVKLKFLADGVCSMTRGQPCTWKKKGPVVTITLGETKKLCQASGSLTLSKDVLSGSWSHYGGAMCFPAPPPRNITLKRR